LENENIGTMVNKELYIISNTSKAICLRPENTASIIRAIFSNNLFSTSAFLD